MAVRFDLTKEVPSLELCERLKELGYPQNGKSWYWVKNFYRYDGWKLIFNIWESDPDIVAFYDFDNLEIIYKRKDEDEYIKAPTAQELKKWLPNVLPSETGSVTYGSYNLNIWFDFDRCVVEYIVHFSKSIDEIPELKQLADEGYYLYKNTIKIRFTDKNEAIARAKMIIWLAENGYVKFRG